MVYLDNEFETPGMRNVLTILTESFTFPEEMGFSLEGELDLEGLRAAAAQHEAVAVEQVERHNFTHTPFQNWCPHCIAHRSRPGRHDRTGESRETAIPTISLLDGYV